MEQLLNIWEQCSLWSNSEHEWMNSCLDNKNIYFHLFEGWRMMFRELKLVGGVSKKPLLFAVHWWSPPPSGACKAVQQDEEEEVGPTAPAPLSPPLLPNASAFHVPSPPLTPGTPVTPSAPSPVEGPGSSECVVCMETGVRKTLRQTRKQSLQSQ